MPAQFLLSISGAASHFLSIKSKKATPTLAWLGLGGHVPPPERPCS